MPAVESFDVVIIGGGPAGVSCSLELKDSMVRHALLERSQELGGQLSQIVYRIRNFGGVIFENGTSLQNKLIKTANELNLPFRLNDEVIAANLSNKSIKTRNGSLIAKAIVLATGARLRKLPLEEGTHLASKIFYRTEGREAELKGRSAVVIGNGDNAVIEALLLTRRMPEVVLVCRSDRLKSRPDLIKEAEENKKLKIMLSCEVRKLIGKENIETVEAVDLETNQVHQLHTPLVVARIGSTPNTELFAGQIEMDAKGCIKINERMETSLAGVYAIGDATYPSYWRISTAVGQGTTAAKAAVDYLSSLA